MKIKTLKPNKLKHRDTIGIIAPSKPLDSQKKQELKNFEEYIHRLGFKTLHSKNLLATDKYNTAAGTPQQRADDLNEMFKNKDIKAIWCFQGGSLANQILDLIDYNLIKKNPKIILGKSDIDILHLTINKLTGLITFHSSDPKIGKNQEMDFDYTKKWFQERLINGNKNIEPSSKKTKWRCIRKGTAEGNIMGCNITTILKLAGTKYFPDFTDSILFLETYKSLVPRVIAQLTQLKQIGVLKQIKGIVIGNNYGFDINNSFKFETLVKDLTEEYQTPILDINEFGHYQPHAFIPIGAKVKLDATNKTLEIIEDFLV